MSGLFGPKANAIRNAEAKARAAAAKAANAPAEGMSLSALQPTVSTVSPFITRESLIKQGALAQNTRAGFITQGKVMNAIAKSAEGRKGGKRRRHTKRRHSKKYTRKTKHSRK